MAKVHELNSAANAPLGRKLFVFRCPGCGYDHPFHVGFSARPSWDWNGKLDKPTFSPSLMVFGMDESRRCHSFVRDGNIEFLGDCFHSLRGRTVELPEYEE